LAATLSRLTIRELLALYLYTERTATWQALETIFAAAFSGKTAVPADFAIRSV